MTDIIRDPNADELKDFIPLQTAGGKVVTPKDEFLGRVADEEQKAIKKGLPFARLAVIADYQDRLDDWRKKWQRQGYKTKKPTFDDIEWKKYSDLKNFEMLDNGTIQDHHLSKINRLPVFIQYKKYRFKGFSNEYTVMEDAESAVLRAQEEYENRGKRKSE